MASPGPLPLTGWTLHWQLAGWTLGKGQLAGWTIGNWTLEWGSPGWTMSSSLAL